MSAESRKVLDMLAAGKITTEDADKLLEKLGAQAGEGTPAAEKSKGSFGAGPKPRFLRIEVEKPGEEKVNLRMPLSFLGKGRGLLAVLPTKVSDHLTEHGFDLSAFAALDDEDFAEAIKSTNIDINKGNGKKVRIFCE